MLLRVVMVVYIRALMHSCFPNTHAVSAEEDSKSIQTLAKELEDVATKWLEVGLYLKMRPDPLDAIQHPPGQDTTETKFQKILLYWMKNGEKSYRTWGSLKKAVERCGNVALVNRISRRKDYVEESKGTCMFIFNFREGFMTQFMTCLLNSFSTLLRIVCLNTTQLYEMLEQLQPQWRELADGLRIPIWIRRKIDGKVTLKQCLTDVFEDWIVGTPKEATFEVLIRALDASMVGDHALAMKASENVTILKLLIVPETEPGLHIHSGTYTTTFLTNAKGRIPLKFI